MNRDSQLNDSLMSDAEFLSDPKLNGRSPGSEGHEVAATFLRQRIADLGFAPMFDGRYEQVILSGSKELGRNICGRWPGNSSEVILIGAHYDHFAGIPGADDNAAALAILLEAARLLRPWAGNSGIVACFFDLEEPPHFLGPTMGSNWFVKHCPLTPQQIKCAIIMDLCGHDVPIAGAVPVSLVWMVETLPPAYRYLREAEPRENGPDRPHACVFDSRDGHHDHQDDALTVFLEV